MLIASIVSLAFEITWLAELLFIGIIVIIAFSFLSKTASGLKETGKSLTKGTMNELESAKGQSPKGTAELGKIFESIGQKTSEIANAKSNETLASPNSIERISQGSKNFLDGLARLFK